MKRHRQQHGAALIMVLLVLALLTFTAVNIGEQLRFAFSRLSNQLDNDQAWWYALGAEDLTRSVLGLTSSEEKTHLQQPWARQGVIFPIDGGMITGKITDAQSCFNLNRLTRVGDSSQTPDAPTPAAIQFERLAILTGSDEQYARTLRERIEDWIDSDQLPTGFNGAEDLVYTALVPPYQTPNQMFISADELHLLTPGLEPPGKALLQLLCTLPAATTTLNINTMTAAQAPILAAILGEAFTVDDALQLLSQRPEQGWDNIDAAIAALGARAESVSADSRQALGVKSEWFHADIAVQHYGARVRFSTSFTAVGNSVVSYARSYEELF